MKREDIAKSLDEFESFVDKVAGAFEVALDWVDEQINEARKQYGLEKSETGADEQATFDKQFMDMVDNFTTTSKSSKYPPVEVMLNDLAKYTNRFITTDANIWSTSTPAEWRGREGQLYVRWMMIPSEYRSK